MPGRPTCPEIVPGRPARSGSVPEGAHPVRANDPTAKLVAHQDRLRERIVTIVGQRQQDPAPALAQADLPGSAEQHERRRFLTLATHLELVPPHAHRETATQGLEPRLLRGEARCEVGGRIAAGPTVGDLGVREDALDEPVLPAIDRRPHPRNADEIDAEAGDVQRSPICERMIPARSSAIAWMRAPSAPSIITRASDSVPEYLMRTRPRPLISAS